MMARVRRGDNGGLAGRAVLAGPTPAWRAWALAVLVLVLGVGVYGNSFPGAFFVDDFHIAVENPLVETMDLAAIFTTDYWGQGLNSSGLFRPLTIGSFAINRHLLGNEPWAYHSVNVLLHAGVAVAFFWLMQGWGLGLGRSLFAAALFALHPIHTEVVNEVVGRSELLVALFFVVALRLSASERLGPRLAAGGCFLLALLAKENALTFVLAPLLVDAFFRRPLKPRLPLYLGLFAIVVLWLLYRHFGLHYGPQNPFRNSVEVNTLYQPLGALSLWPRVLTALKIQLLYLGKLLWPVGLQGVYSGPAVAEAVPSLISGWGAAILLVVAGSGALAWWGWRQRQPYGLAIGLYVLCFAVTANILFVTGFLMAERALYLPSLWFCLGLAAVCPQGRLAGRWQLPASGLALLGAAVLLAAGTATWYRSQDYRDQEALWGVDFTRDPDNVLAGIFLASVYEQRQDYAGAARIYQGIVAKHPALVEALESVAWNLVRDHKPQEALSYALRAVQAAEAAKDMLSTKLATTLVEIHVLLQQPREVLRWLDRIPPEGQVGFYWELKGKAHEDLGEARLAVEAYRQIGELPPDSEVPVRLQRLLVQLGELEEAERVGEWIRAQAVPGARGPER